MKRYLFMLIFTVLIAGCNDGNKQVEEDFNKLMTQNDSIEKVHANFEDLHQEMKNEYNELSQRLEEAEVKDSSMIDNLAAYEVVLQKHDTWMSSHQETIRAHKDLKSDFNNMSAEEKEAQISKMSGDHQNIMNDHKTMRSEHDKMKKDFEDMRKKLTESEASMEEN